MCINIAYFWKIRKILFLNLDFLDKKEESTVKLLGEHD